MNELVVICRLYLLLTGTDLCILLCILLMLLPVCEREWTEKGKPRDSARHNAVRTRTRKGSTTGQQDGECVSRWMVDCVSPVSLRLF